MLGDAIINTKQILVMRFFEKLENPYFRAIGTILTKLGQMEIFSKSQAVIF